MYTNCYIDELYDDIPCEPTCDSTIGTPVPVILGQNTPDIDFSLDEAITLTSYRPYIDDTGSSHPNGAIELD